MGPKRDRQRREGGTISPPPEFRPVRAPKMACLHTCGPGWQCDHASGFQEWRWFLSFIDARPKVSCQVCHNASALQGCQIPANNGPLFILWRTQAPDPGNDRPKLDADRGSFLEAD